MPSSISNFYFDKFIIYPNPSRDIFNIEFNSLIPQNIKIKVFDLLAKEIYSEDLSKYLGEHISPINLSPFSKGIYNLKLITNKGVIDKKLIKQ